MSTPPAQPDGGTPWCCAGRSGYVSECPLCPQYGTSLLDPCLGHGGSDENQARLEAAELHARRAHPDFEYATTRGPRKQWDDVDRPPAGEKADPDYTWERNVDAGRPGQGWDRFDYTEESYWRRRKSTVVGPVDASGPVFITDYVITPPPPPSITIRGTDGQALVTIRPTGVLEYGPGYEPDEAARLFWDALRRLAPARCPACGHIGTEAP